MRRVRRPLVAVLAMLALVIVQAVADPTGLLEIGLDTIWESLQDANFAIVIFAFCISLISRPATAPTKPPNPRPRP